MFQKQTFTCWIKKIIFAISQLPKTIKSKRKYYLKIIYLRLDYNNSCKCLASIIFLGISKLFSFIISIPKLVNTDEHQNNGSFLQKDSSITMTFTEM